MPQGRGGMKVWGLCGVGGGIDGMNGVGGGNVGGSVTFRLKQNVLHFCVPFQTQDWTSLFKSTTSNKLGLVFRESMI